MSRGRPNKYNPEIHPRLVEAFASCGYSTTIIIEKLEIGFSTFGYWKSKHPEFREAYNRGCYSCVEEVELSLYKRATGYEYEDVAVTNYMGEVYQTPITKRMHADPKSALAYLRKRAPERWGDKPSQSEVLHKTLDRDGKEIGIDYSQYNTEELEVMIAESEAGGKDA